MKLLSPCWERLYCKMIVFSGTILDHDLPFVVQYPLATGLLRHQKLVRRFISDVSDVDISVMRVPLFSYMIPWLGYDAACLWNSPCYCQHVFLLSGTCNCRK